MQKIIPFLWFDNEAEEAAKFYTSTFNNSKIAGTTHYGVSWQITPSALGKMMQDKDEKKSGKVMKALPQMHKIDIASLKRVYNLKK